MERIRGQKRCRESTADGGKDGLASDEQIGGGSRVVGVCMRESWGVCAREDAGSRTEKLLDDRTSSSRMEPP